MLSIYDAASAATVLAQPLEPNLRQAISDKLAHAKAAGLESLTHFLVIQPGDTETAIMDEVGFSPLCHPIDSTRFGQPDFQPYWAWLQESDQWYEMIATMGNAGFAYLIFILKEDGVLPNLLGMGEIYAVPASVGEQQP